MPDCRPRSPLTRWYHGWNIVGLCVLVQIAGLGITLNCFSLFLQSWTEEFSLPVSDFAFGVTVFSLGCAICAPFAGRAAARFPAKWLLASMLAVLAAFHISLSYAASGWHVVLLYALLLPVAVTFSSGIPSQTIVSRWFINRVGLAMGLTAFGLAVAGVLFPSLIVYYLPSLGWRAIWRIFAGVILVVILPSVLLFMRDRPGAEEGKMYLAGKGSHAATSSLTVREVYARRNFWVIVLVFVPIQCSSISMTVNLAPIVTSYGFTAEIAGLMIGVLSISALCAKLIAGIAADRFGNRIPMISTALLCAAGLAALINSPGNLPLLIASFILIGSSAGVWTLLASATAAEFGREGFGRAFGLVCMFPPVASLAPPMVARLKEISGSYSLGLSILCGLALLGAGAASALRETRAADRVPA